MYSFQIFLLEAKFYNSRATGSTLSIVIPFRSVEIRVIRDINYVVFNIETLFFRNQGTVDLSMLFDFLLENFKRS